MKAALLPPLLACAVVLVAAEEGVRAAAADWFSSCPEDYEQQLRQLVEGAGGFVHPAIEVRDGPNGRGVFATEELQADDMLFIIPTSLMVRATDNPRMQALYKDVMLVLPSIGLVASHRESVWYLALVLLHEAFYADNSQLQLVFSCWPERTQSSAYWSREEALFATSIARIPAKYVLHFVLHPFAHRLHSLLPAYGDLFPAARVSLPQLEAQVQWALAMVQTRCYAARAAGDVLTLSPLSDLLNHDEAAARAAAHWDDEKRRDRRMIGYHHVAGMPRAAGQELLSSYGALFNAKSAAWYGFIRNDTAFDSATLTLTAPARHAMTAERAAIVAAAVNGSVQLTAAHPLPPALLIQARALALKDDELPQADQLLAGDMLSTANEALALRRLRAAIGERQKQMAPGLRKASALLQKERAAGRMHSVLAMLSRVVIGKVHVLSAAHDALRSRWMHVLQEAWKEDG